MKEKKLPKNALISEELLFRHFSQLTSHEEETIITQWLEQEDGSQEVYDRYQIFHRDLNAVESALGTRKIYNSQQAWQQFRKDLPDVQKSTSGIPNYLKIAASIVLCVAIGWLFFINQVPKVIELAAVDKITNIELEDGSAITLNQGSSLTRPERFDPNERRVSMVGEVYFEIEKDPDRPFIVETGNTFIEVLGTSFNVMEKDGAIEVFVDEGLVKISSAGQSLLLPAGTSGSFNPSSQTLTKQENTLIETHQFWRNRQLVFKGATLADVFQTLEEAYAVDAHFENEQLKNCTITVTFDDESIERILRIISTTLNISITQVNNQIQIDGENSCNN